MYDYGARGYMPDIGRTTTIDPLAENFYEFSPQSFLNNNPIFYIDPTGMSTEQNEWIPKVNDDGSTSYIAEAGDSANTLSKQYGISQTDAESITGTKGSSEIAEGTEISGTTVSKVTGSDILKLDLASGLDTQQRKIDQVMFAREHSKSKGESTWGMNSYFKNAFSELQPPQTLKGLIDIGDGKGKTTSIQITMPFYTSIGCDFCKNKQVLYENFYSNGYTSMRNTKSKNFGGGIQSINVYRVEMGFIKNNEKIWGKYMNINVLTKNQTSFEDNIMDR